MCSGNWSAPLVVSQDAYWQMRNGLRGRGQERLRKIRDFAKRRWAQARGLDRTLYWIKIEEYTLKPWWA